MLKQPAAWVVLGVLLLGTFAITLTKPASEVTTMLAGVTTKMEVYSAAMHVVAVVGLVLGFAMPRVRRHVFAGLIALLSLSACAVAVAFKVVPNVPAFAIFLVLTVLAYRRGELTWDLARTPRVAWLFGAGGLVFGLWYLHWVDAPVALNALLFSPLGVVNCPTMLTVTALLCLSSWPRSAYLEVAVGLTTLYFGFFGFLRLGAYVDVALVVCALFLLVRVGSYLPARTLSPGRDARPYCSE